LRKTDQDDTRELLNYLGEYGVFLVPVGNVEGSLKKLQVNKTETEWLIDIFSKMGTNEYAIDYVRPTKGDVWDFIDRMCY